MRVPVLTAVGGAAWEADLVAALDREDLGITVVRRCVDLADLLATAATGQARAVLLSADLRRVDREALVRLRAAGVAVVAVVPPGDEPASARLRGLGARAVLPADATPADLSAAVLAALELPAAPPRGMSEPLPAVAADPPDEGLGERPPEGGGDEGLEQDRSRGRLVAVWGPTGAPGRTTVAVGLAAELDALGEQVLLVDADVYGGVVAQVLGVLDESPGLAAACRLANAGTLDPAALARLAQQLTPRLRLLSGIPRADRWPELRPAALEVVLDLARDLAGTTVVDCGFGLEQDEELAYDTSAPRRNGATLTVLEQADVVLAVGSADPVGLQRLVRGLADLKEAVPGVQPRVVVNRVRPTAVPGPPGEQVRIALQRYAGVADALLVPWDGPGLDGAVAAGRTLAEAAPRSPVRAALRGLAAELTGVVLPTPRRRLALRR